MFNSALISGLAGDLVNSGMLAYGNGNKPTLASVLGNLWNEISGTSAQMAWQTSEAQKARDFSERMSNTAYQRGVADMESAGINPASIAGTGGASTPGATTAQGVAGGNGGFFGLAMNVASRLAGVALGGKLASSITSKANTAGSAVKMTDSLLSLNKRQGYGPQKDGGSLGGARGISPADVMSDADFDAMINSLYR